MFRRPVPAQHIDVLDRNEQLVAARVLQHHAVVRALADGDGFQPEIFADPVLGVHDQVAAVQRGKLGQEGVGVLLFLATADEPVPQHLLLGEQFELVVREAGIERQDKRGRLASG